MEQAYRGTMLTGKFPACVIYLELSPAAVDVNVHPAKTEIKFSDERRVFDTVHYAVLGALEKPRKPGSAPEQEKEPEPSPPRMVRTSEQWSGAGFASFSPTAFRPSSAHVQRPLPPVSRPQERESAPAPAPVRQTRLDLGPVRARPAAEKREEPPFVPEAPEQDEPLRLIGEALELYILVQKGDSLIVIDKHAAHERIIYDRLRSQEAEVMSQELLEPAVLSPSGAEADALGEDLPLINSLGFGLEPYGPRTYILRSVPGGMCREEAVAALEELASALASSRRPEKTAARDELLKTVACKAAIKAGRSSEPEELLRLAEAVCSGTVRYCPHGRPVSWTLNRKDLDKQFKRIV